MIFRGKDPGSQQVLECEVEKGKIVSLQPANKPPRTDCIGGDRVYLAPGLFDIQVNGFGGTDLRSPTLTVEEVLNVTRTQWPFGTTQYLATITTNSFERICHGLKTVADAMEQIDAVRAGVVGIHLEGPYLTDEDGPRGAHPREYVRKPNWDEFQKFQEAARGHIHMVTLAPELEGALPLIERLAAGGIVVALGHTNAGEAEFDAAIKAGAQISTHLGNGAHSVLPRHANYIQMQLARDELWASFIADGHHLPPYFVKNLVRAKGVERCVLTTDCICAAGAPLGRYRSGDLIVEVGPDRMVRCPGQDCLAGSAATLDECVTNAVRWAGISLAQGVAMASSQPAKLMGWKSFGLEVGKPANLILFQWNGGMKVTHTVVQGEVVFQR